MVSYIENLQLLNRKERFYLVGFALDRPSFELGENFKQVLSAELGVKVPAGAFVAMDYHISWLYAAAVLTRDGGAGPFPGGGGIEKGNQEDVDLLIAFEEEGVTRLLILEAKGVTGWSNKQLRSKVDRLRMIFGDQDVPSQFPNLRPEFAIISPTPSTGIRTDDWPEWMKGQNGVNWIRMPAPSTLLKVTRCDDSGKTLATGRSWKVEPDRVATRIAQLSWQQRPAHSKG